MFTPLRAVSTGFILALGVANSLAQPAEKPQTEPAERAVIRFTDIGSIADWHAESNDELFVQNLNKQWYRITFSPPCQQLPFALGISFEPDSLGNLDNDSSIVVEGERCYFKTIEESAAPISRKGTEQ